MKLLNFKLKYFVEKIFIIFIIFLLEYLMHFIIIHGFMFVGGFKRQSGDFALKEDL